MSNQTLIQAPIIKRSVSKDEFEVKRWLHGKAEGTQDTYLSALQAFVEFTGLSAKQIIDGAEEDRAKSSRARGDPEFKTNSFYHWLMSEYIQKGKGRGNRKICGRVGTSKNLACMYANAIRNFYRANGFPLNMEIPKAIPKKENFKLIIRVPEIKRLLEFTKTVRDRAIILTLFMSGLGIHELCNLTYGDIANGLAANEEPLNLHLIRKKEEVEFDTFVGFDAIEAIKSYLAQRKRNGEVLQINSPLFITEFTTSPKGKKRQIYPSLVESMLRNTALKAGLVTKEQLDASDMSPCRPHALRTAFISILKMAGVNNVLVEYLAGHTISHTEKAYFRLTTDELRKVYKQYEKYLSITSSVDSEKLGELENKAKVLEQNSQNNQGVIFALLENGKSKDMQIANMTGLLTQVQESLGKINTEMALHRLEVIAAFVAAKAPTREELSSFLNRRQISESILQRPELQCVIFSPETNRWIYDFELDRENLIGA